MDDFEEWDAVPFDAFFFERFLCEISAFSAV
jgi:hypothetical protein